MNFNILECRRFIASCGDKPIPRIVHNYELDFYITGPRTINIDGRVSSITDGSFCFRRPGQLVTSTGDYNCFLLTIDFSGKTPTQNYIRNTAKIIEPPYENMLIDNLPDVFIPNHRNDLLNLFSVLAKQTQLNTPTAKLIVKEILFLINSDICRKERSENQEIQTVADVAALYITKNFQKNISLSELSQLVHIDKSYLVRIFKKQYLTTPIEYLINLRLRHAIALLADTNITISEIAFECGYSSVSFFTRQFEKHLGKTPTAYRADIRKRMND